MGMLCFLEVLFLFLGDEGFASNIRIFFLLLTASLRDSFKGIKGPPLLSMSFSADLHHHVIPFDLLG